MYVGCKFSFSTTSRPVYIGADFTKPYKGFRLWLMKNYIRLFSICEMIIQGVFMKSTDKEVDYTYYLGPNYREEQKKYKQASTIVGNHITNHDQHLVSMRYTPAFVGGINSRVGPVGTLYAFTGVIFIGTTSDDKNARDSGR